MAIDRRDRTVSPWLVLLVLCLGFFMIMLDTTIVAIAVPALLKGLDASLDQILWLFNAYLLAYAALLITAGRLGDVWGPRNLYLAGLVVFTAASLACAFAQTADQLIAARIVQGIGGAMLTPQTLTMISAIFPPERRGAAMGVWSGVVGLATVAGPTLGGLLIRYFDWRAIFYLNVPIGIVALAATLVLVPDLRPGRKHSLDIAGVILATVGLFLLVFALVEGQRYDWGMFWGPITIPEILVAGLVVIVAFVLWERVPNEPLVPLGLFRDRNYSVMVGIQGLAAFGMLGFFLPVVILLQSVLGMDAFTAGLTLAPMSLAAMVAAPPAGRVADRFGGKYIVVAGLCLYAAGLGLTISAVSLDATRLTFLAPTIVCGLGLGLTLAPLVAEAMRRIPAEQTGAASGVLNTMRQLGGLIGTAVTGAVLQSQLAIALPDQARRVASGLQVPQDIKTRFINSFDGVSRSGFQVAPGQLGVSGLPTGMPESLAALLRHAAHEVFVQAFINSSRPALVVPLAVVALGAVCGLLAARDSTWKTRPDTPRTKADWLRQSRIFADRSPKELELFARHLDNVTCSAGDVLVSEGMTPSSFNMILEGQVALSIGGRPIGQLGPGDFTDYEAMRYRAPAPYTAKAVSDVKLLAAGREQFRALMPEPPLIIRRADPLNGETPIQRLVGDQVMPTAHFYVRNHFSPPNLDQLAWRLCVGGHVERPLDLSLRDLRMLPSRSLIATLECAGNGRAQLEPRTAGEQWELGAVSTAEWTGVPLLEVLQRVGVKSGAVDIVFRGADSGQVTGCHGTLRFERSLCVEDAFGSEALLAYAMNGERLPVEHGFPLRVVVPGWYGVASVKWLTEVEVLREPFKGFFQAERYVYEWQRDGAMVSEPVTRQRVRSIITEPASGAEIRVGQLAVRGLAWSGAAPIARVEVRTDSDDWQEARLLGDRRRHSWMRWEMLTRIPRRGAVKLQTRATDLAGRTQPEQPEWNRLGYGCNMIQTLTVNAR
ncbi:MAG TPA: DHA2 family efflux MFS transporter permease subunit [Candidatus Dormibacteraeota bacterium]